MARGWEIEARSKARQTPSLALWWCGCALLVLSLIALPRFAGASTPQTIEWYMIDLPPIQNQTGEDRGAGYTDWMRWRLIAGLDGYRHVLRASNVHRMLHDIEAKPNVCNTAFLHTAERERFMVYADPLHTQLPNGVAVMRARLTDEYAHYLDIHGAFKLYEFADTAAGVVAVQSGRRYGPEIDAAIARAEQDERTFVITTNERPMDAKFGLLRAGRVDVVPMYPFEKMYHLRDSPFADLVAFLPVAGPTVYTLNHMACSRSELGVAVIERANALIAEARDGYFAAAYRHWLPESMRALHASHHQQAFGVALSDQDFVPNVGDQRIADCLLDGGAWFNGICAR